MPLVPLFQTAGSVKERLFHVAFTCPSYVYAASKLQHVIIFKTIMRSYVLDESFEFMYVYLTSVE